MQISQNGIDLIKKFEGCRLSAYDDATGKAVKQGDVNKGTLTIGYGHTSGVKVGQVITQEIAELLLKNDLVHYSNKVQELIRKKVIIFNCSQNMFDALVSFCYNCGQGNLIKLVSMRTISEVGKYITQYNKANGKELEGLTKRRQAEKELFLKDYEPYGSYVVKQGDTLTKIAYRLNLTVKRLVDNNKIEDVNKIFVGQVLKY